MASEPSGSSSGIGCGTVLFFIFLTLKLTGHIDWSWWWVTAPLWGSLALLLFIVAAGVAFAAMAGGRARRRW